MQNSNLLYINIIEVLLVSEVKSNSNPGGGRLVHTFDCNLVVTEQILCCGTDGGGAEVAQTGEVHAGERVRVIKAG